MKKILNFLVVSSLLVAAFLIPSGLINKAHAASYKTVNYDDVQYTIYSQYMDAVIVGTFGYDGSKVWNSGMSTNHFQASGVYYGGSSYCWYSQLSTTEGQYHCDMQFYDGTNWYTVKPRIDVWANGNVYRFN